MPPTDIHHRHVHQREGEKEPRKKRNLTFEPRFDRIVASSSTAILA
jgi:hypothetical protein